MQPLNLLAALPTRIEGEIPCNIDSIGGCGWLGGSYSLPITLSLPLHIRM